MDTSITHGLQSPGHASRGNIHTRNGIFQDQHIKAGLPTVHGGGQNAIIRGQTGNENPTDVLMA